MPDASAQIYTRSEFADQLLRRKDDTTTADPNYAVLQRSPDVVEFQVAVAADGLWRIQPTPMTGALYDGAAVATPSPIDFTRAAAETDAQIATALAAAATVLIASGASLFRYYSAATSSSASVLLTLKHDAPRHTYVNTAPGGSTLTTVPDDTFPIATTDSPVRSHDSQMVAERAISFIAVNSSDVPINNDTGCTLTVEAVRLVQRRSPYATPNAAEPAYGVTSSQSETIDLNDELRLPLDGGRWTIRIAAVTNPPTNLDAIEVRQKPVHT